MPLTATHQYLLAFWLTERTTAISGACPFVSMGEVPELAKSRQEEQRIALDISLRS